MSDQFLYLNLIPLIQNGFCQTFDRVRIKLRIFIIPKDCWIWPILLTYNRLSESDSTGILWFALKNFPKLIAVFDHLHIKARSHYKSNKTIWWLQFMNDQGRLIQSNRSPSGLQWTSSDSARFYCTCNNFFGCNSIFQGQLWEKAVGVQLESSRTLLQIIVLIVWVRLNFYRTFEHSDFN